ncbi:hypothetical protein C8R44DRAFT_728469 [Mycena epipterygia]|nr:hypothetical protein C8R44DRAFT_728469 [Mycena epipterygia]
MEQGSREVMKSSYRTRNPARERIVSNISADGREWAPRFTARVHIDVLDGPPVHHELEFLDVIGVTARESAVHAAVYAYRCIIRQRMQNPCEDELGGDLKRPLVEDEGGNFESGEDGVACKYQVPGQNTAMRQASYPPKPNKIGYVWWICSVPYSWIHSIVSGILRSVQKRNLGRRGDWPYGAGNPSTTCILQISCKPEKPGKKPMLELVHNVHGSEDE